MAQYEEGKTSVVSKLTASGLSSKTSSAISGLLDSLDSEDNVKLDAYSGDQVAGDTQILTVGAGQTLTGRQSTPVIIMDSDAPGANVELDTTGGDRLLVAGGGNDIITSQGDVNVSVETGGGDDSVSTGNGDDAIVVTGGGNSTVSTGDGDDAVEITGEGRITVDAGNGNDQITIASDTAQATVDGGNGFDRANMDDSRGNHHFTMVDGILTLNSSPTQLENVEVVQFQDGISVIAEDASTAEVARLYEVVFDREADLGGLEYWINKADSGESMSDIATGFVTSQEFHNEFGSVSNEDFLANLYQGMAGRDPDAEGLAYWLGQMEDKGLSQADVALQFAGSQEAIKLMGIDGSQYVIDVDSQG